METRPYILHALSPLHVGVGQSAELIDLPIARLKGTNMPYVPGSAIKGVLREALFANPGAASKDKLLAIFGPELDSANDHAGALVCADAWLFALPVRSYKGTFAYVTCPLLLALARRDLGDIAAKAPSMDEASALVADESALTMGDGKIYLEDLDLISRKDENANLWAKRIAEIFGSDDEDRAVFTRRFAIVDDETMTFLWETATQTDTRVRIDRDTGTVADKALWIEESLPPETLLFGLLAAERSRKRDVDLTPVDVLDRALKSERVLQFGGKATVGRGRCRIVPL